MRHAERKKGDDMSGEREWVETVKRDVEKALARKNMIVETSRRLPYAMHISSYKSRAFEPGFAEPAATETYGYQTDLLIAERLAEPGNWVPRVVVEFKLGSISTHDALTYSAKAATHKNVHPYLRYGIVVGKYAGPVPRRLMRHGHQFDFMLMLQSDTLTDTDRKQLVRLLKEEVEASRSIGKLLTKGSDARLVHRKLVAT